MTIPPAESVHQPSHGFYSRWCDLNAWLATHEALWRPSPFTEPAPQWIRAFPALADWLDALDDADCDRYEQQPVQLATALTHALPELADHLGLPEHRARIALPQVTGSADARAATLPERRAVDMPGRKREQAGAFAAAITPLVNPVLDWCCGKGHLARTLASAGAPSVVGLEWQTPLVADGNGLAERFGDPVRLRAQDVMDPELAWPEGTHGVALHACGDLHRRLLTRAADAGAPRLSLSPCCYHLHAQPLYRPLSDLARGTPGALTVDRDTLRLAVQETVTAPARVQAQTDLARQWRLGFDELQRTLRQDDEYLPVPPHPTHLLQDGFAAFCRWAAARKGLALPDGLDWDRWRAAGARRLRQVRRHELLRHLFRRPLELWLVLDYAVYLEERGYRVRLGEFCERNLTPRNLLLDAIRVFDTPPGPRSRP